MVVVDGDPTTRRTVEARTATSPMYATIFGALDPRMITRSDWKVASDARRLSPANWDMMAAMSNLCMIVSRVEARRELGHS